MRISADPELIDTVRSAALPSVGFQSDVRELDPSRASGASGATIDSEPPARQSQGKRLLGGRRAPQLDEVVSGCASSHAVGELQRASAENATVSFVPSRPVTEPHGAVVVSPAAPPEFGLMLTLGAVAGFIDTASVLTLYGMFTAHVTGDLVSVGVALARNSLYGLVARLSMLVVFVAGVAGTTLFARRIQRRGRAPLTELLSLMAVALAGFFVVGSALEGSSVDADSWSVMVIGATAVMAMAVQNTLMRNVFSGASPTTIMTGNLTQITIDVVEYALPSSARSVGSQWRRRREARQRIMKFGVPLVGFIVGVCLGGYITSAVGLVGISLPTTVVGALAFSSWRRELAARAQPSIKTMPISQ